MNKAVIESYAIAGDGFTISRETKREANVVTITLERGGRSGTGECVPLRRYNHTTDTIRAQIDRWVAQAHPWTRSALIDTLPAGPARFALDTALWQLEAAERGLSLWQYMGFAAKPGPLATAFTLSGAAPEKMATMARERMGFRWLKLKLMGDGLDEQRLEQIHAAVPEMDLLVDANEAFTKDMLLKLTPVFHRCNVKLIEQPLPADKDGDLQNLLLDIPLAADESCHDIKSLDALVGKYQVANIKLDKSGGLTHALEMVKRAKTLGLDVMIGCMASTSLGIMPAFFAATDAAFVDLDGALLLAQDRADPYVVYQDGKVLLS